MNSSVIAFVCLLANIILCAIESAAFRFPKALRTTTTTKPIGATAASVGDCFDVSIQKISSHPSQVVLFASKDGGDGGGGDVDVPPPQKQLPKAIIFDLDGCLWTPEMYEIMYFQGGRGSPFREDPNHESGMLTCDDQPVRLLGDVRSVFEEMYYLQQRTTTTTNVRIGISSRTDEPDWARELLSKFKVTTNRGSESSESQTESPMHVYLKDVFNGPIEIATDSKKSHFERIRAATGIDYKDMVFFDNEYGNCEQIASLGVSVVYCPDGVTRNLWEKGVKVDFPRIDGSIINGGRRGRF